MGGAFLHGHTIGVSLDLGGASLRINHSVIQQGAFQNKTREKAVLFVAFPFKSNMLPSKNTQTHTKICPHQANFSHWKLMGLEVSVRLNCPHETPIIRSCHVQKAVVGRGGPGSCPNTRSCCNLVIVQIYPMTVQTPSTMQSHQIPSGSCRWLLFARYTMQRVSSKFRPRNHRAAPHNFQDSRL